MSFRISGEEERDNCRISTKNSELLRFVNYCLKSKIQGLMRSIQQQRGKGVFFQFFTLTGLKGRMPDSKYLQINTDIKENNMSTFITAVFAVIYTLIAIGQFIWAIVVAYRGLVWFLAILTTFLISGNETRTM